MGLDMYLRAKTTKRDYEGATGACSGLFNMAPEDNGMVEIGYWRKAYDQDALIASVIKNPYSYGNCENVLITKEEIETILEKAKEILKTHTFDEDGYDTANFSSYRLTYNSEGKWIDTVEFFEEALSILEEDKDAEIYYCSWA